jgi:hypothetical protein
MDLVLVEREEPAGATGDGRRYERFEAITVRAAARVLRLQQCGVVAAHEAEFYLRELAAMDAHAGRGAHRSLLRAAQRQAPGAGSGLDGRGRAPARDTAPLTVDGQPAWRDEAWGLAGLPLGVRGGERSRS